MGFVDKPVINSPFDEPKRNYQLDGEGQPTGIVLDGRRESIQVVPVPAARQKVKQDEFQLGDGAARVTQNRLVNEIRARVALWRTGGRKGTTPETQRLLDHWSREDRGLRLFFCQIEAVETLIYLTEV